MRAGAELERLVASIKGCLHPQAKILSPASLPDVDTGEAREVDVLVVTPSEAGEIRIVVECRDRATRQDVTWIEQLIAKKDSVGADLLIAVSASQFYKPAIMKAAKRGVLVRNLTEALGSEISDWAAEAYVEVSTLRPFVSPLVARTRFGEIVISPDRMFFATRTGRSLTTDEVIGRAIEPFFQTVREELQAHGARKRIRVDWSVDGLAVRMPYETAVESVHFEAILQRQIARLPLASGFAYEDAASARSLVDGYRFGNPRDVGSDLLVNVESGQGRWIIDLTHIIGWWDTTTIKCATPIALTSAEFRYSTNPLGTA